MSNRLESDDLETRARRRVGRKLGLFIHAGIFVGVNAGLYAINALTGEPHWARLPLLGWGLGLAIHAAVTVAALHADGLRQSMVRREIEQLRRRGA